MALPNDTCDEILRGRLRLWQSPRGYRVNIDPLLLAAFVAEFAGTRSLGRVADLGTGSGVLALVVALLHDENSVDAFEVQPDQVARASRAAIEADLAARVHVHHRDLRQLAAPNDRSSEYAGAFDWVVTNPPYVARGGGVIPPDPERAISRYELECTLEDVSAATRRLLSPRGHVAWIYPASRADELVNALTKRDISPVLGRYVHARASGPADRVMLIAKRGEGSLQWKTPLALFDSAGQKTAEHESIANGAFLPNRARS